MPDPRVNPPPSAHDLWITKGHDIVATELARARELAVHYPVVNLLLPRIEATLHALFSHMVSEPSDTPSDTLSDTPSQPAPAYLLPSELAAQEHMNAARPLELRQTGVQSSSTLQSAMPPDPNPDIA